MMLRMEFRQFVTSTLARLRRDTLRRRRVRHGTPESLEPRVLLNATLVKDINPLSYSSPSFMAEVNGTLYFQATDGTNGYELWKSDGTSAGTVLVKDIWSGGGSSGPSRMTNVNGTLYFAASDGTTGFELWKSNGTSAGTVLVKDIWSGGNSYPHLLTDVNGTLYFTAYNPTNGAELWKSDGTEAGTVVVRDIRSGGDGSNPQVMANVNGTLYFTANDGINGYELWKSNGTSSGTVLVKDIRSGGGSGGSSLTNVNGTLYFTASDGTNGAELWKSDGTEAGTVMVRDIQSGGGSSVPVNLTNVNGTLYFRADDGTTGAELWKSNGTSSGTVLVRDVWPGGDSKPDILTEMNGTLYFDANDGTSGYELWKSDGTSSGTVLVKDIWSGGGSTPVYLTNLNGMLYFQAYDETNGVELWRSDGTSSGTVLVKDIWSGGSSSNPYYLTNVNGTLYFRANDGTTGNELWKVPPNLAPSDITLSASPIAENLASGTAVGILSTTDPDAGDTFTYTLVSGTGATDNASFTIGGTGGNSLLTAASFDFETQSSYSIRVRTTDLEGRTFEKQFTITVSNVNEPPANLTLSASSIAENQSSGTTVGVFTATDPDAGTTLTYSLVSGAGDTDNASFTILNNQLKTAASFDFETKSSYSIRARVSDGILTAEQQFTITVTDGNDGATQITLSNVVTSLLANSNTSSAIPLADVSIVDDGLGTNTFSVSGADAGVFEVVGNQLRLKAGTVLNYATKKTYAVTVNVDDTTVGATPDASVNYILPLQGLDATIVQNGSVGRSYVRYVTLAFGTTQGLAAAVSSIGTVTPRMSLTFAGLTGTQSMARSLTNLVSVVGTEVRIDFGINGVGGDRNSFMGDGVYRLRLDLDGDGQVDVNASFFRLFGDVDGNGVVNDTDIGLVQTAQGQSGGNLATDLNGDGLVNLTDLNNVKRRKGAKVAL
jgi:ELWxxDGT repeat protein